MAIKTTIVQTVDRLLTLLREPRPIPSASGTKASRQERPRCRPALEIHLVEEDVGA
jgi:hypothetical protein